MKKIIILLALVLTTILAYSETIILTTGEKITGSITGMDAEYMYIKTSYGETSIKKEAVAKVLYTTDEEQSSTDNTSSFNYSKQNNMKSNDYLVYEAYRKMSAGSGMLAAGITNLSLMGVSLLTSLILMPFAWVLSFMVTGPLMAVFLAVGLPLTIAGGIMRANGKKLLRSYGYTARLPKPKFESTLFSYSF